MANSLFPAKVHRWLYYLGLFLLAAALPLSKYAFSAVEIGLTMNWLLEGGLRTKLNRFFSNKAALVFTSIFLLHLIGLVYTTDFDYALKDIRTKLPLLLIPLYLASSEPLPEKRLRQVIWVFISAVLVASFISTYLFLVKNYADVRYISPFISHIRLSLNVCLAIFLLCYNVKTAEGRGWRRLLYITGILWLMVFLLILQSLTGYIVLLVCSLGLMIYLGFRQKKWYAGAGLWLLALIIPLSLFLYTYRIVEEYLTPEKVDFKKLEWFTPAGNAYEHDTTSHVLINGHYVWLYICRQEMREAWNKRSKLAYDSIGPGGSLTSDLLIRYLTSKGLRKDSSGVNSLDKNDIALIEKGVSDANDRNTLGIGKRIRQMIWEYMVNESDPNGHSVMMRLEYWKTSIAIIKDHFFIGVGTGDMNKTFESQYVKQHSKLSPENRRRSHDQYLSIFVGFGVIGFAWFMFALFYPAIALKQLFTFRFGIFFFILLLSMIPEDTIESQEGVTFATFFYALFLFTAGADETQLPLKSKEGIGEEIPEYHDQDGKGL